MILNLGCIVEGHGDVKAVPRLLRRLRKLIEPPTYLNIPRPTRISRDKLVQPGELEKAVEAVARRLSSPRAILILVDADDDCPKDLGPALASRATQARPDITTGVVLAKREFEAWFLAAIESLCGQQDLRQDLAPVGNPEGIRNAKGALTERMAGSRIYKSTVDQDALTALFDMELARTRSDSFGKCWREVERLFGEVARRASQ